MYWIFASLLIFAIFCLWHRIEVKLRVKKQEEIEAAFWQREAEANNVRRKPIDHLDYIQIPKDLHFDLLPDHVELPGIEKTVSDLREEKILNLTGYTNTDLKLKYGTANITELTKYDSNFTALVTTLQKWADILLDNEYEKEAMEIMEFLVSIEADIGKTYRLLGKYYLKTDLEKYETLIQKADNLRSLNKPYIVQSIKDLKE